ncbi:helix-turn-helix domain-containing protein [Meridianimaribacter flavus]|uniref:AraC family transcriptional regulator n=1 Tax=Meridianimaribacter flavus TaxID=571115 RepID=A0ABY2G4G9_9FLAO|nr:AraC family transcriptional regulator [Meridianimaribacter flavus]TDY11385.1 AraC family transcriptional regulator [Meridianimaribacter flavus]
MDTSIALIVFSSIAVTSCVFLASYFLFIRKESKLQDLTLGLLFIAIALRILKSIFYYVLPEISPIGTALGFLGFALIGPLTFTYLSLNKNNHKILKPILLLHVLFPVIGFVIILINSNFAYDMYLLANVSFATYLVISAITFISKPKENNLTQWHKALFYGLVALSAVLIYQLLGETISAYATGIALSSIVIYFLFFYALQSPSVVKKSSSKVIPEKMIRKITKAMEDDKIYYQPGITLAQFAEAIDAPNYLVSRATKKIYNKSFPEVINSFRIKAVRDKLSQPEFMNEKIEDLAYDVGFNTSSAFYNAFKKEVAMTPREYQTSIMTKN